MSREEQAIAAVAVLMSFLEEAMCEVDRKHVVAHATLSGLAHHWPDDFRTSEYQDLLFRTRIIREKEASRWMTQRRIAIAKAAAVDSVA